MIDQNTAPLEWEQTPQAPAETPIELFPSSPPNGAIPPEVAASRGVKAHIAAGSASPGIDQLTQQIQSGLEDDIRSSISQQDFYRKQFNSQALVSEYFSNKGMAADDAGEVAYVSGLAKNEPERLASVIEKKYAENRLDLSLAADRSGAVQRSLEKSPDKVDQAARWAVSRIVAKEKAQKYYENLSGMYDQQGVFRKALDFSKSFLPGLTTYGVTNVAPDAAATDGITKGVILRQQYRNFFSLPPDEQDTFMQNLFDKAAGDPSELQYAMEWFAGVQEYSAEQARYDNLQNYFEVGMELTPAGVIGPFAARGGMKAAGIATRAVTRSAAKRAVAETVAKGSTEAAGKEVPAAATTLAETAGKAAVEAPTPQEQAAKNLFDQVEATKTQYTQDEIEHIHTHWDEAVVVRGEVFDNGKVSFTNEELDTPLPEYQGATLGEVLDGSDSNHFRAMMKARLKYGSEAVDQDMMKPNSHGYIDPSNGKFVSTDSMYAKSKAGAEPTLVPAAPKAAEGDVHIAVDVPNPDTGEVTKVNVPVNDNTLVAAQIDATTTDAMRADVDIAETAAATGDIEDAATNLAVEELKAAQAGLGTPSVSPDIASLRKGLQRKLASFLDPFSSIVGRVPIKSKAKDAVGLARRLSSVLKTNTELSKTLNEAYTEAKSFSVMRISGETWEKAKPILDEMFKKEFSSASDGILDVETKYLRESDASGRRLNGAVYTLGRPDKTYFSTAAAAKNYADTIYKLPNGYYNVVARGSDGFVLEVTRIMDETNPKFAGVLVNTTTKTPVTMMSAFTSYLKGGSATSSDWLAQNLKMSTHAANRLHNAFAAAAKEIGTLSSKEKTRLEELMVAMRDTEYENGYGKIIRGKWADNAVQFEQMYARAYGHVPSDKVTSAYFVMRQLHDFDWVTRNGSLYTEMARLGIEEFKFTVPVDLDADPIRNIPGTRQMMLQQDTVLARAVDELPSNQLDNSVLILDEEGQTATLHSKAKDGTAKLEEFRKNGYRYYQIANPDQRPFQLGVNDNHVQFVLAKTIERRPLSLEQLPYSEGGHVRTAESFFVKQAKFRTTSNKDRLYLGDTTFSGHSSEAEASKFAAAMEKGRKLMLSGDVAALEKHVAENLPHRDANQFTAQFRDYVDEAGRTVEATFDKDVPFGWVADGQGMNDAAKSHMPELRSHFEGVKDTIDDPNNLFRLLGKKFTGQKDQMLRTVVEGDGGKAWKFDAARHISPLALMEQSAADLSRIHAINDLKHAAAMHWIEEAAPLLETPLDELRQDPWAHFMNPQWKGQYIDVATMRALEASRVNTLGFMGLAKNPMDSTTSWVRGKLMNSVYERFGGQKADWVDEHLLPSIKNPVTYMRAFAYHTKLGLFNPVQLFLQSQTMFHTWAITGNAQRVGSALSGLTLSQAARFADKSLLTALDKKAQGMGWKAGEWLESHNLLKKLKLDMVEGEIGQMDLVESPSVFQSKFGQFLNKGTFFFKEAERAVRVNAWHVAFKEFRDKFPTKVIGNEEALQILRRQEVLTVNMTRAGNAWWQRGLLSPATQFWGYQARIVEQMLGHQLTRAEKLRVGLTYGTLYGLPVSLGAATFMQIPGASTDDIREYALKKGIDVNSGVAGLAMNGIPASLIYWMTSDENGQNGLLFNIGERVGPGGLPVLKDVINGDKTAFDIIFGASFSIGKDALKMIFPEDGDIIGAMTEAPSKSLSDYANVFSTVSTVNNTNKLLWALFTHRNMTRNGVDLGEISTASAVVRFLTGLEEQRFQDIFLKMDAMQDLTEYNKEITKEYRRQYQAALKLQMGSPEREAANRKLRALLEGVDQSTRSKILWMARQPNEPLDKAIDKQFQEKVVKPNG